EAANNLITEMQTTIKQVDTSTIKAWIVDLRKNMGGNMWPMLTGIGPVLGNGLAGKFVDADSVVTNWYYTDGISSVDGHYIHCFTNYYILKNPNPFVAVLTDNYTGSSGEAIVVSFRGRQKTRSFGINTMGRSTANKAFILSDGAKLFLTVATMADRNGVLYGKKIVPDENIKGIFKTNPLDNDEVVNAAINWIENVSKK
ncbi:MAG: S41 family peptidase, partial [Ignavibacteria bacterium]|nr:S41 family peptidase [Ignavibacteria bacterium]